MPLTRAAAKKLQQLEQFAFVSNTNNNDFNEKKRKGNFNETTNNNKPNKRRKLNNDNNKNTEKRKISIKYDDDDFLNEEKEEIMISESPFIELTANIINEGNGNGGPPNWINVYEGIFRMRNELNGIAYNSEVDRIGAACLFDKDTNIKTQRFHVLISLLLSSQTKDNVTAKAMYNLREYFDELTVESICNISNISEIDDCIKSVGFHNRKSQYLFKTANILKNEYNGDIPNTLNDLLNLPGVGPKMSYIIMQIAWNKNIGIGVDVHVHRITNLLGWTRKQKQIKCKNPEETRKELQKWIPKQLWPSINRLFVGFGQKICTPKNPKCKICQIKKWCPIGSKLLLK